MWLLVSGPREKCSYEQASWLLGELSCNQLMGKFKLPVSETRVLIAQVVMHLSS